ncbi:MAG: hypothetical protein AB7U83_16525 [Vicinamibacterales bacterium]
MRTGWRSIGALGTAVAIVAPGCDASSPTAPSGVAVVTFQVVNEQFRVRLTTEDQLRAAQAAQAGGQATIPVGRIVAGAEVNTGWSWHLEDVTFAEVAIEVCDGLPSHVEQAGGPGYALGWYCPWGARVLEIRTTR